MGKKGGLGKGLGAIFGENSSPVAEVREETAIAEKKPQEVAVEEISANPYQPRREFDEEKLQELAASVKEFGILQPLVVRAKGNKYELVAGERRLRAAKMAGLVQVPVIIKEYNDSEMMEIALVENIQRHDLNAMEEAQALRQLITEFQLTQEQVAQKIGRSRTAVTNLLRLLNLASEVQELISHGALSMGQAKSLLGLKIEQQVEVAQAIVANGWSSRMVEEVIRKLKEGKQIKVIREVVEEVEQTKQVEKQKRERTENDLFCMDFQSRLVELLGTKVKVLPKPEEDGRQGGTIQIEYYSAEDLERIYEVLNQSGADDKPLPPRPARKLSV